MTDINLQNLLGKVGGAAGGVAGIINTSVEASKIKDTTDEQNAINTIRTANTDLNTYD
jgi:hypothetical protein